MSAAAAAFAALNLATAAVLGRETYRDYIRIVLPTLEKFRSYGFNLTFAGFCSHLFDPAGEHGRITPLWPSPAAVRYGTLLSDLIATAFVASLARRAKTPTGRDLAYGVAVTAMLLVSPVTWEYSIPLLLVPLAVITASAEKSRWMLGPPGLDPRGPLAPARAIDGAVPRRPDDPRRFAGIRARPAVDQVLRPAGDLRPGTCGLPGRGGTGDEAQGPEG